MQVKSTPIRVLVVDDSAIARNVIAEVLRRQPDIQIVGFCENGGQVEQAIDRYQPDVITLDVEMPTTDGPTLLRQMQSQANGAKLNTPVVMVSSLTNRNAQITMECLALGALDFVLKPGATNHSEALSFFAKQLPIKIRTAATANMANPSRLGITAAEKATNADSKSNLNLNVNNDSVIILGASTGGPKAVAQLLEAIGTNCPPVIVAIHMPSPFTKFYAERMNKSCTATVREAIHLDELHKNTVYIAPGHKTIRLRAGRVIHLEEPEANDLYKPSIDRLFESAGMTVGKNLIACVLTGMGRDGTAGAQVVNATGGTVISQNEQSCVVYGMPKSVSLAGLSQAQLSLNDIAIALFKEIGKKL
jgi:two-component system, chemotaxis family, protein-glutamate methylesterase/glutaminase